MEAGLSMSPGMSYFVVDFGGDRPSNLSSVKSKGSSESSLSVAVPASDLLVLSSFPDVSSKSKSSLLVSYKSKRSHSSCIQACLIKTVVSLH